ncbi:MAG TPA: hypothetical protein VI485_32985 [Vicinamibacterales bacterium]|nr:hypothetical protein [Vicinamibacterales bacterium]
MRSTLVVCGCLLVVSCQATQPEPAAPPAAVQPEYTTTATVKDIMLSIVDPAGDLIWDSVSTIIDKGGVHETIPKTDDDWAKVRSGTITLLEASNLLMIPGRQVAKPGEKSEAPGVELEPSEMEALINKDRAGWNMRAKHLHDVAADVMKVIDAKDTQKLFDIGEEVDRACENCHRQYWYPNEVIPPLPSSPAAK